MSIQNKNGNSSNGRHYVNSVAKIFATRRPAKIISLAPSILSADFANLSDELKRMMRARCYWAHLDVMDGHFVPNITFGPPAVKSIRAVSPRLFLDTHLMISEPLRYAEAFAEAGSDLITFHAETVKDPRGALRELRRLGVKTGVTIKPKTPVKAVQDILDEVDMVLVMTVEPGFGGQGMLPNTLSKVRQLAKLREGNDQRFLIQVDGGINAKTVELAVAAGANILVAGSAVFGQGPGKIRQNIESLASAGQGRSR